MLAPALLEPLRPHRSWETTPVISGRDTLGRAPGSGWGGHVCDHERNPAASLPHIVANAPAAGNNKIQKNTIGPLKSG